jgi:hypothetical protein
MEVGQGPNWGCSAKGKKNAGLKKLSQVMSKQTSDSSFFLNAICLLKYVLNCEQHFSYFDLDSRGFILYVHMPLCSKYLTCSCCSLLNQFLR